jgi:hypothetical protein
VTAVEVLQAIVGFGFLVLFLAVVLGIPCFVIAWVWWSWHYQPGRLALAFVVVWVLAGIGWFVLTHPWISAAIGAGVVALVLLVLKRLRSTRRPDTDLPAAVIL